jgi:hypothetical protein
MSKQGAYEKKFTQIRKTPVFLFSDYSGYGQQHKLGTAELLLDF